MSNRALYTSLCVCVFVFIAREARATDLLVPSYFGPGDDWTALTSAAQSGTQITAILNPASGPGTSADPSYTSAINSFEVAGGTVIAYVPTGYAKTSLTTVESNIKTYESFYPQVQGFFLDEMTATSKTSYINYYSNLYSFIKAQNPSYTVFANAGEAVPSSYAKLADTIVTYEGTDSGYASNTAISWSSGEPASKFANIVYECPDTVSMFADLAQAQSQNVGYVYFTDDGADGNPYDSLPSYFSTEVGAVPEPAAMACWLWAVILLKRPINGKRIKRRTMAES